MNAIGAVSGGMTSAAAMGCQAGAAAGAGSAAAAAGAAAPTQAGSCEGLASSTSILGQQITSLSAQFQGASKTDMLAALLISLLLSKDEDKKDSSLGLLAGLALMGGALQGYMSMTYSQDCTSPGAVAGTYGAGAVAQSPAPSINLQA